MPVSKTRKKAKGSRPQPTQTSKPASKKGKSPAWYVAAMASAGAIGVGLVLYRYIFQTSNSLLLIGIGLIGLAFVMTTNYR